MKILLNLIAAKQGGQVTRANEFINKFQSSANKGDLLIILLSNFNPLEIKNNKSIQVIKVHFPFNLKNWLARIIWENTEQLYWVRALRPDIYLTFSHALPFTNLKIPTVVAVSNLAPFSKHAFIRETLLGKIRLLLLKYFIIFFTNKATSVIALSQLGRKNLINNGVYPSKITKIMIGVKKQEQQDKVKKNKIYKINEKYILYVSHFYKYKNFEQLILAYSSLPKSTQDIYGLKLVGNFSDKKYVEKLIQMSNNLGLSNRIDFIPGLKEKELNLVYKQASLFVLSSVIENCPSVLLEAMANRLPVLVTNVSPMPEFVKNAGKYFEIGDHLELSKKINKILSSSKLLRQMSLRSYKQAKLYSWDSFTKNVVNFCRATFFTSKKNSKILKNS